MKSKILLRIAAGLIFIHGLGHTMGHINWKHAALPAKQEVINQMTEHKFPFMGTSRSMGEYYEGYGYASTLALLFIAVVVLIVSGHITDNVSLSRKLLISAAIILFAWGIDELIFFFPFAAGFSIIAGVLIVIATLNLNRKNFIQGTGK
ncbi:MAG TPA: hypothetical protein VIH57_20050 [Bacteroidales bacterium]